MGLFVLPKIIGILNVTPDSFSDGGDFFSPDLALKKARKMIADGADMIDIGGESTAPNSLPVSADEEWLRLKNILPSLLSLGVPIFLDTKKALIARKFFEMGGSLLNDVSGFRVDKEEKIQLFRDFPSARAVLMFSQQKHRAISSSEHFEKDPESVLKDICNFFIAQLSFLEKRGLVRSRFFLDPGMGAFLSHNPDVSFFVLNHLSDLCKLGMEIVVGTSRKSFLAMVSDPKDPKKRLVASVVSALLAAKNGANFLRVHDVQATKEALLTYCAIKNA
jgi:dihydropteroate synthase